MTAQLTASAPLVFLDTETLGLALDDPIWEIAAIRHEAGKPIRHGGTAMHAFVHHTPPATIDLPPTFRADYDRRFNPSAALTRTQIRHTLLELFAPAPDGTRAHLVGACPDFDARRIAHQLHIEPWHHHIVDVEALAAGWLAGQGRPMQPHWNSNDLSRAVGVDPDQFERHTAMGDVRWAEALYSFIHRRPAHRCTCGACNDTVVDRSENRP